MSDLVEPFSVVLAASYEGNDLPDDTPSFDNLLWVQFRNTRTDSLHGFLLSKDGTISGDLSAEDAGKIMAMALVPSRPLKDYHDLAAQLTASRAECEGLRANAQFLLDRLSEYDPTDEKPYHHFFGHVEPAMARLRATLSQKETGA